MVYLVGGGALVASSLFYLPGKNPRWVLAALGWLGIAFAAYALVRGRSFLRGEATGMLVVHLVAIAGLSRTTHLDLGALSNGIALPLIGVYAGTMLGGWGAVVYYAGALAWLGVMAGRGDAQTLYIAIVVLIECVFATEVIRVLFRRVHDQARLDPLTGVLNRAGVEQVGEDLVRRALRRSRTLSLALVDLDDLRGVNNAHGHHAGDEMLVRAARHWAIGLGPRCVVGRIGGDEFVLLLPGHTEAEASEAVEALRRDTDVRWTAGVAQLRSGEGYPHLVARADAAMYELKTDR
jgi:diguanylate cyclase (GGDEF)-like protein